MDGTRRHTIPDRGRMAGGVLPFLTTWPGNGVCRVGRGRCRTSWRIGPAASFCLMVGWTGEAAHPGCNMKRRTDVSPVCEQRCQQLLRPFMTEGIDFRSFWPWLLPDGGWLLCVGRGSCIAISLCRHWECMVWWTRAGPARDSALRSGFQILLRGSGLFVGSGYQGDTADQIGIFGRQRLRHRREISIRQERPDPPEFLPKDHNATPRKSMLREAGIGSQHLWLSILRPLKARGRVNEKFQRYEKKLASDPLIVRRPHRQRDSTGHEFSSST